MKMEKIFFLLLLLSITLHCQSQVLKNAGPIDTTEVIQIGGIKQYISIKGNNRANPVLLLLHGGPGRSLIGFSDGFTDKLKNEFVVVNWDQRATGETLKLNPSGDNITVSLLKKDALEVARYLLGKFHRKKLFLVSHSWGSVMGFDIAQKHPEMLYAYVPISPMIDAVRGARMSVSMLKKWALKIKNDTAARELAKIKIPFKDKEDLYLAQKWLFTHNEVEGAQSENFKIIFYQWMDIWFDVWKENAKSSLFITVPEIKCPVYFFEGIGDNQTYYTIAAEYYKFLKARKKKIYWFKKSGHTIFNTEPEKLQKIIIEIIKRETY